MSENKLATHSESVEAVSGLDAARNQNIQEASGLISGTMGELERMLDAKSVIGEPMTFGSTTIIPLVSVGFGFGAGAGGGGGTSNKGESGQGGGGGGGGGGGVKPIAVLVIEGGNVRLEAIPEPVGGLGKLGVAIASAIESRGEKSSQKTD